MLFFLSIKDQAPYGIQTFIAETGVGLIVSFLVFILGTVTSRLALKFPNRNLWKLSDPKRLIICVSESSATGTGKYLRPATGIGQVRALAIISPSLTHAYGRMDTNNIHLSTEELAERREADLISLGGSKNNQITRDILVTLRKQGYDVPPPDQLNQSKIAWKDEDKQIILEALTEAGVITEDHGLIIRAPNPFCTSKTAVVLAGASTFGVVAAARFFVEKCKYKRGWFVAIVTAPVRGRHTLEPRLVWYRQLRKQD